MPPITILPFPAAMVGPFEILFLLLVAGAMIAGLVVLIVFVTRKPPGPGGRQ